MKGLQEKFQILSPAPEEDGESWTTLDKVRDLRGQEQWCSHCSDDVDPRKFNYMPPGMDIGDQCMSKQENQKLSMGGESDVSRDTNGQSFAKGYIKKKMNGSDDQYTGEHVDLFYGDAGGFVERNNYLDRM